MRLGLRSYALPGTARAYDPDSNESLAEFIKRQEERRKMRLNDEIYDITAWSLPMLWDVELVTSPTAISVTTPLARVCRASNSATASVRVVLPNGSCADSAPNIITFNGSVLTLRGGRVADITAFVTPEVSPRYVVPDWVEVFGLPERLA